MGFEEFKAVAITQDSRNTFGKCEKVPSIVPDPLKTFYRDYNPVDVEINIDGVAVRFYPADDLEQLQNEYSIPSAFVFATCNGDPIFISEGIVYSCPHGVSNPKWEIANNNLLQYFSFNNKADAH